MLARTGPRLALLGGQPVKLTHELLLPYQGLNGFDGLCHVRIYEDPGQLPVTIAGGLTDNPGTSNTNATDNGQGKMECADTPPTAVPPGRPAHRTPAG
jgi:hypothetical protein